MAITKILPRNARLDAAIRYILNGDKTDNQILTAYFNCDPGWAYRQMMDTKRDVGRTGGRMAYHIIQSFEPGEATPELALEIVKEFTMKHRLRGKAYLGIVPPYPQKQTFAGMNREVMKSHWRNNRGSRLRPA